ncbi:hypothetical protein BAE44_0010772 [Dichanthelium oligosanthes]|uniref:Uncharacterized protein n=1 Tax=Dichanthelium oligosanthes TaxID=888268 RepID=A0A1E5VSW8_9POAL|nr:hypothetical protein BAE44_0010772 [Dichanthelium oligosanthes]
MARLSATASLFVLLLSLLAVAHCRPIEADPATDAEPAAAVVEVSDENGPPNPALPSKAGVASEAVLPAEQQQHGFLRLPSHRFRHHRPCRHGHSLFHRHLWWARHHGDGVFGDDTPRRFHRHGEPLSHLSVFGESREVKPVAVAEPDPDHSLPDSDGEGEVARMEPSFGDAADEVHAHEAEAAHEDEGAAVTAWKKEMLRRWFHFHHHHGMRHHHKEEGHEQEEEAAEGLKRFHHHRRHSHDEEEEEKNMMRKRFRRAEHDEASDSDDEDEEVEEVVRRFRKAIMRRRFGSHGHRFHHHRHHYSHRHADETEKADAQEDGGVVSWIKGLVNRF